MKKITRFSLGLFISILMFVALPLQNVYAEEFITQGVSFSNATATENINLTSYTKATLYANASSYVDGSHPEMGWPVNGTSQSSVSFNLYTSSGTLLKSLSQKGSAATLTMDLTDISETCYFVVTCSNGATVSYQYYNWHTDDNSWHGPITATGCAKASASSLTLYKPKAPEITTNLAE